VTAIKAHVGETLSAAGSLQAAACVLAMNDNPGGIRAGLINAFSTSGSTPIYSSLVLKEGK
jgi:hypothetical protein